MTFAIILLDHLRVIRFLTKDELYAAIKDCGGMSQCVALRYHVGSEQWVVLEASEY